MPFAITSLSQDISPAEATAKLVDMKIKFDGATPAAETPAAARAELNQKINDPSWSAKFAGGSAELREEFNQLLERGKGDRVDQIIAGTAPVQLVSGGEISNRDQMESAAALLESGITPRQIERLLTDEPLSRVDYEVVQHMKREKLGDPEFVKKWLAGEAEPVRLMKLIGIYEVVGYKD